MEISGGKYKPHKGGCSSMQLPSQLRKKKCLIEFKTNTDCFMYSVLYSLHPVQNNPNRKSNYIHLIDDYNFSDVRGIVDLEKIGIFEKNNNISVNVYSYNLAEKFVIPLRIAKHTLERHIRIFLYNDHYYPITSFQRLLSSRTDFQRYHCERCLFGFREEQKLFDHVADCNQYEPQRVIMPKRRGWPSFIMKKTFSKEEKHPFVIYADFECLCIPTSDTQKPFRHEPCSYGYVVIDWKKNVLFKNFSHGTDIVGDFLREIRDLQQPLQQYLKQNIKPLVMSEDDEKEFRECRFCTICSLDLDKENVFVIIVT